MFGLGLPKINVNLPQRALSNTGIPKLNLIQPQKAVLNLGIPKLNSLNQNSFNAFLPISINSVIGGSIGFAYWNGSSWSFSSLVTGVSSVNTLIGAVTLSVANSGSSLAWVNTTSTNSELRIPSATTSITGLLTSTDWNTFNGKQAALSGTGFVKISGTTISYDNSTYLTANQTITLSGDVSGSGSTAITTTIGANKVTNAMLLGSIAVNKLVAQTASQVAVYDASGYLTTSGITTTDLSYISGGTSNFQNQINNINSGLSWKVSARVATTASITLSATQTVDGILLILGDRILVKNQLSGAENGVYVVAASAWSRSTDCSTGGSSAGNTSVLGMTIAIEEGGTYADQIWICTTDAPITINTTTLTYAKSSATTYTGSGGILLTGNNFTINTSWAGQIAITTLGTINTGTWNSTVIGQIYGGTGFTTYTTGDMLYASAANTLSKLSIGATNKFLTVIGGIPTWSTSTIPTSAGATANLFLRSDGTNYVLSNFALSIAGNLTTAAAFTTAGAFAMTLTTTLGINATLPNHAAPFLSGSAAALTSGRVPYVTTNGLLIDNTTLTYDGTLLTVSKSISAVGSITYTELQRLSKSNATALQLSSYVIERTGSSVDGMGIYSNATYFTIGKLSGSILYPMFLISGTTAPQVAIGYPNSLILQNYDSATQVTANISGGFNIGSITGGILNNTYSAAIYATTIANTGELVLASRNQADRDMFFVTIGAERWRISGSSTSSAIGNLSNTGARGTAGLHLKGSAAGAANTGALKFATGVLLGTGETGAVEYNGTNLFFTRIGTTREGVLTQSAVTTEVVVSDTTVTVNIGGTTYKLLAKA